ncbi:CPBP family intramembrane glutamic endopeptidase [Peribacillus sp. NPDC097675]|uniref:CPBP family intramembrane glutamic endopeptidase n=1 Tax=Peribacillus sp. NPDC097675 TaxID=3390618 RepID=UPI003D03C0B3
MPSKTIPWSWRELVSILVLVLIVVPFFIEFLLANFLLNLFQNDLYSGTLVGFIMSIMFMLAIYFITLRPKGLKWNEVGLNRFPGSYGKNIIGWTILLIVVSILMIIVMDIMGVGVENSKTESVQSQLTPINFVIGFVSAAIISPIYEEILYRGFLYRWFRSKWGLKAGLFLSSFIFMIVHIPNYNVLPVTFVSGLLFAWTYEKTKSVLPGMIIHGTFNAIAIILTSLG